MDNEIAIQRFTGEAWANALQGKVIDDKTTQILPRTHEVRKGLPYYRGLPWNTFNELGDYTYIVAHVQGEGGRREVIGMVELQLNPHDKSEVWLKFLSVCEEYRQRGIASRLAQETCSFLSTTPWKLKRSRPSEMGEKYLKPAMDRMVGEYGLCLSQGVSTSLV